MTGSPQDRKLLPSRGAGRLLTPLERPAHRLNVAVLIGSPYTLRVRLPTGPVPQDPPALDLAMKGLAIINLSALDAYTDEFGEDAGAKFAHKLYEKISSFEGPVYIVDQNWLPTENSAPRMALKRSLRPMMLQKDIAFEEFRENEQEWPDFLRQFRDRLQKGGVSHLVLGGLWYDPDLQSGAVSEAYKYLGDYFPSIVDPNISAHIPKGRGNPGLGKKKKKRTWGY